MDKAKPEVPITLSELDAARSRAKPRKSSGSDGLPVEFHTATWDFTGPVLERIARTLQKGEKLPEEMVHANVSLLHKSDSASPSSSQFRPIALLNADYKLIAATLAARLAPLLSNLVDELQTGFVPGRLIMENLTLNRDLIDFCHDESHPLYMAFLDFEKAFDRVSWSFRDRVMESMGFPASFIDAIRGLYANSTNSLLINSSISRAITQSRGVRQGCPLSPFLFALFAEPLGLLLRSLKAHEQDRPQCGIKLPLVQGEIVSRYRVAQPQSPRGLKETIPTVMIRQSEPMQGAM